MTALCPGGGPSGPKEPDIGVLVVSAGLITGGLTLISPWLIPFAVLLDAFVVDIISCCGTDPPPMPTWTAADLTGFVGGVLNDNFQTSLTKLHDTVINWLWFKYCQCTSATTPAFQAPQPPSGVVVGGPAVSAPCSILQWTGKGEDNDLGNPGGPQKCINTFLLPNLGTVAQAQGNQTFVASLLGSPPPVQLILDSYFISDDVGLQSMDTSVLAWDAAGNELEVWDGGVVSSQGSHAQKVMTLPAGAHHLAISPVDSHTPAAVTVNMQLQVICSGQSAPGSTVTPCATDPAVLTMLQEIYQYVQLIQRQNAPFGYVPGATHAGLTGLGELDVADLLGVKITPSTLPAVYGQQLGDPDELWLESWITWGNADGWSDRVWLRHSPQVSLPALAGQYTKLGYSLAPGLVVNITELEREP